MNEPGFPRFPAHRHLDPSAQEFFPAVGYFPPPICYPFPPPPPPVCLPPSSSTPTRTLLLSMVPVSVSESTVRRDLEVFGDVRAVQMERRREGLVTVHFYDIRDSQAALAAVQEQHMHHQCRLGRHYDAVLSNPLVFMTAAPPLPPATAPGLVQGHVVWAQYINPVTSALLPDGNNLGSLVVFNLDPMVSPTHLQEIFGSFGPVKEMRGTPKKRQQRFVEFYDVRNAAKAMAMMNRKEICGQKIVIEYSKPGGRTKKYYKNPTSASNSSPELMGRRNPNASKSCSSSSGSVASLCISGYEECSTKKPYSFKRFNTTAGGATTSKSGGRPWKGSSGIRQGAKDHNDARFLINIEDAINWCDDSRTTVMIKNIPNKYSQKLLLNMLDNHCINCNEQIGDDQPLSAYDFVYLPIDFINKCNVGYGFVNMTTPQATLRLYKAFHHQSWEVFNSRKICDVTYARLQGLEALREHFKNSKFPGDAEEYMPVVFSPPRDGRILTDPAPIICRVDPHDVPATLPLSPPSSAASSLETQSELGLNYGDGAEE